MDYSNLIDQELRKVAKKVPYNRAVIAMAKVYESMMWRLIKVPGELAVAGISLEGYKGLPFKTEIFEPAETEEKLPCLLYIHGGAFSYKASPHHKKLACIYAKEAHCRVILPDYHLLPKYRYPAAYEDVLALYRWILENAKRLKIDEDHIAVGGDSAGGTLAALLCNSCERVGLKIPCAQMLIYPATDKTLSTESMKKYTDTPLWNAVSNRKMWEFYLKDVPEEQAKNASPFQLELPEVLPYTYVETAEFDCLHDEGILYAEKLKSAGAEVEVHDTKGTVHGYDCAVNTRITEDHVQKRTDFLKRMWLVN